MNTRAPGTELRWAGLEAALKHVERWLAPEVERVASTYEGGSAASLHGLFIGPEEARRSIAQRERTANDPRLADAVADLPEWPRLAERFGLDHFEGCVLLLALAPEIDSRFARLYGFAQDDLTRVHPSYGLILTLLATDPAERLELRRRLAPDAPLLRNRLVEGRREPGSLWLATRAVLDPQLLRLFTGDPGLDERVAEYARLVPPSDRTAGEEDEDSIRSAEALLAGGRPGGIWLDGQDASAKRRIALAAAGRHGLPFIEIDESTVPFDRSPRLTASILVREAVLKDGVIFLDGLKEDGGQEPCPFCAAVLDELHRQGARAFLAGAQPWLRAGWAAHGLSRIAVQRPSVSRRETLWQRSLSKNGFDIPADQVRALARRYRLTGEQIETAAAVAGQEAVTADPSGQQAPFATIVAATRAQTGQRIGEFASRRPATARWKDLVLPEDSLRQLREFCRRVELRESVLSDWGFERRTGRARGVHALFAGASGTGKTMAAEIMAGELGLDLFRISVPNVVSKFIGETEKNLDRIFNAAEDSNAILFFDEADSIVGKRSEVRDSHDRYANLEISYLLQRMEEFDGVSILATNLRANIDDAFTRRLSFVVHFPFPDAEHRRRIWDAAWPDLARGPRDFDVGRLADAFKLSGGSISNIALAASFLAADRHDRVEIDHVVTAIRREYQKLGRSIDEAELRTTLLAEAG